MKLAAGVNRSAAPTAEHRPKLELVLCLPSPWSITTNCFLIKLPVCRSCMRHRIPAASSHSPVDNDGGDMSGADRASAATGYLFDQSPSGGGCRLALYWTTVRQRNYTYIRVFPSLTVIQDLGNRDMEQPQQHLFISIYRHSGTAMKVENKSQFTSSFLRF